MDLWNIKDLEPPPVTRCKGITKEIDMRLLDGFIKDGVHFFENQLHLFTEAALLSRAVYRFKMKFRSSKDFKSVEKLNHTLKIYKQMHVSNMFKILLDSIPHNYIMNKTYILTKNMMDYVLVRLQGLGKLLCRIMELCKIVSSLMQQRLRLGHFWNIAIVIFATAARIFLASKNILKYSCELYGNLLPYSSSLSNCGVQWLPDGYSFPSHLDEWLNIDWLDLEHNVIEILDDDPTLSYLKLTDSDDEVEFCDEYILVRDESMIFEDTAPCETIDICEESLINCDDSNIADNTTEIDEDIGEVINVSDTEVQLTPKRKRKKSVTNKIEKNRMNVGVNDNGQKPPERKRKKSVPRKGDQQEINPSVVLSNSIQKGKNHKLRKKKEKKRASKGFVNNSTVAPRIPLQQKHGKFSVKPNAHLKKTVKTPVSRSNNAYYGANNTAKKKKNKRFTGFQ